MNRNQREERLGMSKDVMERPGGAEGVLHLYLFDKDIQETFVSSFQLLHVEAEDLALSSCYFGCLCQSN